jgi:hypothetical protein
MNVTRLLAFGIGASFLGAMAPASQVIIGNMPGNDGTSTFMNAPAGGSNGGGDFDSKAAGFTMPGGLPYTLDSVTLRLNFFNTVSVPRVQMYTNVGGNPGSLIQTLANPSFATGTGSFVFTPTSTLTLNAGQTYWIVVWNDAPVANSFQWMANQPSIAPSGIATNAGYRFNFGAPPPTGNSTVFNTYEVHATLVPEPASGLALLLAGGALLRRRRRSKA